MCLKTGVSMKYVIFSDVFVVMWFGPMNHIEVKIGTEKPTSAGFVKIVDGIVECAGNSTTLNMAPSPDDAKLISAYLGIEE